MANKDSIKVNGLTDIFLGAGYSTASGDIRALGIQGAPSYHNGGESNVKILVTQSSAELDVALGFDLSKSINFEKIASFKEKLKFLEALKVSETSVCIVVRSTVTLPVEAYKAPVVIGGETTEAALKTNADVDAFCTVYGDSYVSSIEKCAQFICIYKYECHSLNNKTKFFNEITAAGIVEGVVVSASYGTAFESTLKKFSDQQEVSMAAIGCEWPIPSDKNIIETAFEFQNIDKQSITGILRFSLTGYEHVFRSESAQNAFKTVRANRLLLNGNLNERGILLRANSILRARHLAEDVKSFYSWYGVNTTGIHDKLTQIETDLQEYSNLVEAFSLAPSQPFKNIPHFPSYYYGMPSRNCIHDGVHISYGGDGGSDFNDRKSLVVLNNQWRLSQITARGDDWMNWIEVTYEKPNGEKTTISHGEPGGDPETSISLGGNSINSIIVSNRNGDWYQNCLVINTSSGASMSVGSVPAQEDQVPIFKKSDDGIEVFIGFHGACGKYIDALGGSTTVFKTPAWN